MIETWYKRPRGNVAYTRRVLEVMRDLAVRYTRDSALRSIAAQLAQTPDPVSSAFALCKSRIKYTPDPEGIEDIRSPYRTIVLGEGGDCDDMATAGACLLKLLGHAPALRAIAWRAPDFTHVYAIADARRAPLVFDVTAPRLGAEMKFNRKLDLQL